jgi:hypothetical protein
MVQRGGGRSIAVLFLDLDTRRGGWSAPRFGRFTSRKKPVSIAQKAGWAPGPVWTCAKNLNTKRIRSPGWKYVEAVNHNKLNVKSESFLFGSTVLIFCDVGKENIKFILRF